MATASYTSHPGIRDPFYDSAEWREFAAGIRERDGHRCTVAQFLGGQCSGPLHVNHIRPRRTHPDLQFDPTNCGTACASHHPQWEKLAKALLAHQERQRPRCTHSHRYAWAREECERRMAEAKGVELSQCDTPTHGRLDSSRVKAA